MKYLNYIKQYKFIILFIYPTDHAASATSPTGKMLLGRGVINLLKINNSTASLKIQGSQVS